ncbi:MAG: long-chain fatty acid--CoA ligase [Syntrophus sp. (in: bacteria)]|nr:long-chain fatty acid--CoA ligase [Syntrophus sp. (in: bacteria)]
MSADTFPKLLLEQSKKYGSKKIALREKDLGIWQSFTWEQYLEKVKYFSLGMISLGFEPGDKISIIGDNKPEWIIAELAAQCAGGLGTGIYQDSILKEVAYIINHSETKFVIAEDQEQVDKILDMQEELPNVKKVIYYDPKGMSKYDSDLLAYFPDVMEMGREYEKSHPGQFEKNVENTRPEDVAWICTTSGTTGFPKLAMLTHKNLISMATNLGTFDPKYDTDEFVSFLPLPWVGEQMMAVASGLLFGLTVNFPESVESAQADLREIGPHIMFSPPRVWENMCSTVQVKVMDASFLKRAVFNLCVPIGRKWSEYKFEKKTPPFYFRILYTLAYLAVFKALKDRLGFSNIRSATTGGAALGPDTFKFFHALGISLKQIYGQTEISGISCVHKNSDINPDTMGEPIPETEVKISESGEILSKSPAVFPGYYKQPEETAKTVIDGWLHSGDAGYLTPDGHIVVIDRIKDVMSLIDGIKFSPQFIENKLKFSPYIKEAVTIGHNRDFIIGMICIDFGIVGNWAEKNKINYTTYTDLSSKTEIVDLIQREVEKVNKGLPDNAKVKRFVLLYKELDPDDDELTRTRKVRRHFVEEKYKEIIEGMYEGKDSIKIEAIIKFQDGKTSMIRTVMAVRNV